MGNSAFREQLLQIAVPVTVQSLLQSSLGLIDQIMIGRLGSGSIAGIGLAGKCISLFTVTCAALVTVLGILIAQYRGARDEKGVNDSFFFLLYGALLLTAAFSVLSLFFPRQVMSLYADDTAVVDQAAVYLRWRTLEYLPSVVTLFLSALLRVMDKAVLPALAGVAALVANTLLNWLLIFGARMGAAGAALATALARILEMAVVAALFVRALRRQPFLFRPVLRFAKAFVCTAGTILVPVLVGEFLWSLGENMYAVIYGHLGTEPCAAMTLMYPIQGIAIGALTGVSAASGIIVGKSLGARKEEQAWSQAWGFVRLTVAAGVVLGVTVWLLSPLYVRIFNVPPETRAITQRILIAFSLVFTAKVFNMVVGGGVLQAGGQTKFMTAVNIIGTWGVGVPLGFISAAVLHLPVWHVYFILSLEEYVRLAISMVLLCSRRWMRTLTAA